MLVIVAIVGSLLYRYVGSTAKQVEKFQEDRPLAHTRLAADQATLASMQGALQTYRATNEGKLPPDKAAVAALHGGPPALPMPRRRLRLRPVDRHPPPDYYRREPLLTRCC